MKNIEKTMVFEEIMFSARVASRARFWTLLASLLGAFWPPRWLKPVLEFLLERPRAVQDTFFWLKNVLEIFQEPPRADQDTFFSAPEASKRPPRGLQEAKGRLNRFLDSPSGLQQRSGSHFGPILESF